MQWRGRLVEALTRAFAGRNEADGVEHALEVERAARELLDEPEYGDRAAIDLEVVVAGSLMHEIGFANCRDQWGVDAVEHLEEGVRLGMEILSQIQAFEGQPERVDQIRTLIAHHDDTTYAFPSKARGGAPAAAGRSDVSSGTGPELLLLREADAIVHTHGDEIARSIKAWQEQDVPWFTEHGPQVASWMWHECVAANLRLSSKRAVLDASTENGRHRARGAYDRLEELIKRECERSGVPYQAEICTPGLRESSVQRMAHRSFDLKIVAFHGWDAFEKALRACPLKYDSSIHPYDNAEIRSEIREINGLTPMALYVFENRITEVLELHDALMIRYCFGLWDLPGWLTFTYNSPAKQDIAPPLIEEYNESKAFSAPRDILAIVDGLHRCTTAQDTGVGRIRVVLASQVNYPVVPLPVTWPEVQRLRKRHYRYNSLDEFLRECPHAQGESEIEITDRKYRYWYYRDLSTFGSQGERTGREFEELRAD